MRAEVRKLLNRDAESALLALRPENREPMKEEK
jgi:hypothetical protein